MKIRVCTYNILVDGKKDGPKTFNGRKDLIQRTFTNYIPDLIGFQEMTDHVVEWWENEMGYRLIGHGRDHNYSGESIHIGYRPDRIRLLATDTFWLSPTPRVPASYFVCDQSKCPRICTIGIFMTKTDRKIIRMYNVHLDHLGKMARAQEIALVLERITQDEAVYPGSAVVITGDFNAEADELFIGGMSSFTVGGKTLTDLTSSIDFTYHAFKPATVRQKIDYIFTNTEYYPESVKKLDETEGEIFLSDHYPIIADIEI